MEIVHRFEKQRTLTFEQLRDDVFGQHWQDETWHEVLRLICNMIDPGFAGQLIEFLMKQEINQTKFLDENKKLKKEGLMNLLLAADCLSDVNTPSATDQLVACLLLDALKHSVLVTSKFCLKFEAAKALFRAIINFRKNSQTLYWLKKISEDEREYTTLEGAGENYYYISQPDFDYIDTQMAAIASIADYYNDDPQTLLWLSDLAQRGSYPPYPHSLAAIDSIAKQYKDDPQTLPWLQKLVYEGDEEAARFAVNSIAQYYKDNSQTLQWLQDRARLDDDAFVQWAAVEAITEHYKDDPQTLPLLKHYARTHSDAFVRYQAVEAISENFNQKPEIHEFFCTISQNDPFQVWEDGDPTFNPRLKALKALFTHYPTHPKTLELLGDRAENDPDEQLRQWAGEQLKIQNVKLKMEDSSDG